MSTVSVRLDLADIGLEARANVKFRVALAQTEPYPYTADTTVLPSTDASAETDVNGAALVDVARSSIIRGNPGLYRLFINGEPLSEGPFAIDSDTSVRALLEAGRPVEDMEPRGQQGWIWSPVAPANPVTGLGWARVSGSAVLVSYWDGAAWVAGATGSGGGGGLTAVATDDTITGDGTSDNPLAVANPYDPADVITDIGLNALRRDVQISPASFTANTAERTYAFTFTMASALDQALYAPGEPTVRVLLAGVRVASVENLFFTSSSAGEVTRRTAVAVSAAEAARIVAAATAESIVPVQTEFLRVGDAAPFFRVDSTLRLVPAANAGEDAIARRAAADARRVAGDAQTVARRNAADVTDLEAKTESLSIVTHDEWENVTDVAQGGFWIDSFNDDGSQPGTFAVSHLADQGTGGSPFYNARLRVPLGRDASQYRLIVGDTVVPTDWSEDAPDASFRYYDERGGVQLTDGARVRLQRSTRETETVYSGDVPRTPARDEQPASKAYVDANAGTDPRIEPILARVRRLSSDGSLYSGTVTGAITREVFAAVIGQLTPQQRSAVADLFSDADVARLIAEHTQINQRIQANTDRTADIEQIGAVTWAAATAQQGQWLDLSDTAYAAADTAAELAALTGWKVRGTAANRNLVFRVGSDFDNSDERIVSVTGSGNFHVLLDSPAFEDLGEAGEYVYFRTASTQTPLLTAGDYELQYHGALRHTRYRGDVPTPERDEQPASKAYVDGRLPRAPRNLLPLPSSYAVGVGGVRTVTLPADYAQWDTLKLVVRDDSDRHLAAGEMPTEILALPLASGTAQMEFVIGARELTRDTGTLLAWVRSTRILIVLTNNDTIYYAQLR